MPKGSPLSFKERVEAERARRINGRRAKTQKKPKGEDIFVIGLAVIVLVLAFAVMGEVVKDSDVIVWSAVVAIVYYLHREGIL